LEENHVDPHLFEVRKYCRESAGLNEALDIPSSGAEGEGWV